ncbi:hypothetical protein [Paraburkholderia diazotrophica]|uniref:hypothetical protein n=1 Tax=Paraburkholderia diazotrophica TaxID=667676 RepID=UPI00316B5032
MTRTWVTLDAAGCASGRYDVDPVQSERVGDDNRDTRDALAAIFRSDGPHRRRSKDVQECENERFIAMRMGIVKPRPLTTETGTGD